MRIISYCVNCSIINLKTINLVSNTDIHTENWILKKNLINNRMFKSILFFYHTWKSTEMPNANLKKSDMIIWRKQCQVSKGSFKFLLLKHNRKR